MVHEALKTNRFRSKAFFETYLAGDVLDIGAGHAPVTPTARRFDKRQGDAQTITDYFPSASFDCIHSSHCLEHMKDVPRALLSWWQLVRPGGYLVFVVPDEDLYEQGAWPSLFNSDHKATFRLGGGPSWSPVSYEVGQLVKKLPDAETISIRRMDDQYDRRYGRKSINRWQRLAYKLLRVPVCGLQYVLGPWAPKIYSMLTSVGLPIDQTMGPALAQIEVVLRKQKNAV